jgi:hypothetical protein
VHERGTKSKKVLKMHKKSHRKRRGEKEIGKHLKAFSRLNDFEAKIIFKLIYISSSFSNLPRAIKEHFFPFKKDDDIFFVKWKLLLRILHAALLFRLFF